MSSDRKNSSDTLEIKHFFDELTYTLTYLVFDKVTRDAVIIDPVLDYDQASSSVSEESIAKLIGFIKEKELKLLMVLETHAHADHISGAQSLKKIYSGIPIAIGESISKVQQVFKSVFDLPAKFPVDGSQFDRLIRDGEKRKLRCRAAFSVTSGGLFKRGIVLPCVSKNGEFVLFEFADDE